MRKYLYSVLFISSIFCANWMILHIGNCVSDILCVIPVWKDIYAPSGVLAVGLGFTLRDLVQRNSSIKFTMMCIIAGAILSAILSPQLALASGLAYLFSETLDLTVYTPLHKRNLFVAVIFSNLVGLVADSAIFLYLADIPFTFFLGQIIGKSWMILLSLPLIWIVKKYNL